MPYPEAATAAAPATWDSYPAEEDVNPGISPVAAALPAGDDVRAVGYDGYLDSCQVLAPALVVCLHHAFWRPKH